jgi:hypothetical protein
MCHDPVKSGAHDLPSSQIELWIEDDKRGIESALRPLRQELEEYRRAPRSIGQLRRRVYRESRVLPSDANGVEARGVLGEPIKQDGRGEPRLAVGPWCLPNRDKSTAQRSSKARLR